jgi:hypothetical protein
VVGVLVMGIACSSEPPTATPRPSRSEAPPPNPALSELAVRIREGLETQGGMVQIVAGASAGEIPLATAVASMSHWAEDEAAWLDDHPPEACFADAHAAYLEGVNAIAAAVAAFTAIAEASQPPDEVTVQAAIENFDTARSAMENAQRLARADVDPCRG